MAEELSSVRAEHKFDETALHEYLKKNLQGFPRGPGTLNVLQYRFVFDLIVLMISKTSDLSSCIPADSVDQFRWRVFTLGKLVPF